VFNTPLDVYDMLPADIPRRKIRCHYARACRQCIGPTNHLPRPFECVAQLKTTSTIFAGVRVNGTACLSVCVQEIWANAHGTRDSISLISCAAGLSWSIASNFGENSLFKCASQPKIAKNSQKRYFSISVSFKVIDVGTPGKLISGACYDMQQVCLSATVLVLD